MVLVHRFLQIYYCGVVIFCVSLTWEELHRSTDFKDGLILHKAEKDESHKTKDRHNDRKADKYRRCSKSWTKKFERIFFKVKSSQPDKYFYVEVSHLCNEYNSGVLARFIIACFDLLLFHNFVGTKTIRNKQRQKTLLTEQDRAKNWLCFLYYCLHMKLYYKYKYESACLCSLFWVVRYYKPIYGSSAHLW